MSNYLIFAYYDAPLDMTLDFLNKISLIYNIDKVIFVNNNLKPILIDRSNLFLVIKGSNLIREFSAWDEGYFKLKNTQKLSEFDKLFFLNDTIITNIYLRFTILEISRSKISKFIIKESIDHVLGPIVNTRIGHFKIFDGIVGDYIATFFLLLEVRTLNKIHPFSPNIDWGLFLNQEFSNQLFIGGVDNNYLKFYNNWLGCNSSNGIGNWKKSHKYPYNRLNFRFLYHKAQCIILESNFTAKCNINNINIINLYPNKFLHFIFRIFFRIIHKFSST